MTHKSWDVLSCLIRVKYIYCVYSDRRLISDSDLVCYIFQIFE